MPGQPPGQSVVDPGSQTLRLRCKRSCPAVLVLNLAAPGDHDKTAFYDIPLRHVSPSEDLA